MRTITKMVMAALCLMTIAADDGKMTYPELTGRVVDTADQIPADQEADLERQLADFQKKTQHRMVIVTIPDLNGVPKEEYALALGRHWKIGRKGVDDGIIMLQSPGDGSPGSGKLYISVGYGLEDVLTDVESTAITKNVMVPILKQDRPRSETTPDAIVAGAQAVMKLASRDPAEMKMAAARERMIKETKHREFMASLWDFLLTCLGIGAIGAGGYGTWRFATRKERARLKAVEAERQRVAAEEAAERRRIAEEQAAKRDEEEREARRVRAEKEKQRVAEELRKREKMLADMTPERRQAFLDAERREQEERDRRQREREEEDRRERERQREMQRERDEEDARAAAVIAASMPAPSPSPTPSPDNFGADGGSFGGAGGGTDY